MKKVFLFAAIIFMSVSFMGNYVGGSQNGSKSQSQCPYLNNQHSSSDRMICPYLKEHNIEMMEGQCPFLNGNSNSSDIQCPYLKEQQKPAAKEEKQTETIDMVST